jgi:hypothetical protein
MTYKIQPDSAWNSQYAAHMGVGFSSVQRSSDRYGKVLRRRRLVRSHVYELVGSDSTGVSRGLISDSSLPARSERVTALASAWSLVATNGCLIGAEREWNRSDCVPLRIGGSRPRGGGIAAICMQSRVAVLSQDRVRRERNPGLALVARLSSIRSVFD